MHPFTRITARKNPKAIFTAMLFGSLLTGLSGLSFALDNTNASKPLATKNPAAEALTALNKFHQALQAGNAEAVLALLSDNVVIYESGHGETRAQYEAHHLQADITFAKSTTATSTNTVVDCDGNLCVIHQQSHTSGTYKGKTIDSNGTETAVLRLGTQGWRISHVHWSNQ